MQTINLDFVAMTDKNWKSHLRRDPGINGFVPDFSGSSPDDLTKAIFEMVMQLNQSKASSSSGTMLKILICSWILRI